MGAENNNTTKEQNGNDKTGSTTPSSGAASAGTSSGSSSTRAGGTSSSGPTSSNAAPDDSSALVKQAKDAVVHVADKAYDQAKEKIGQQLTESTKKSVGEIGNVAKALKHTSEELGDNIAAPLVGRTAEQIQKASDFLKDATVDDIVGSVQSFAKREPLIFLGGAFFIGMLGARFLKSSSHHQVASSMKTATQSRDGAGYQGPGYQVARLSARTSSGSSNPAASSARTTGRT